MAIEPGGIPRAVLFDLDDTLASRSGAIAVYARMFLEDHAEALHPCTADDIHRALTAADDFGSMRQAERLCAAPLWRHGVSPQALLAHWDTRFGRAATPVEGMQLVLDELAQRGVKLGIVTNGGTAMQRSKIEALGIAPVMSAIVISQEVGLRKPDPAIFHRALAEVGCAPDAAWFVGDNPEVDIEGAIAAGLRPFWIETPAGAPPPRRVTRLSRLADLLGFL